LLIGFGDGIIEISTGNTILSGHWGATKEFTEMK
jgi:hypothetical protein